GEGRGLGEKQKNLLLVESRMVERGGFPAGGGGPLLARFGGPERGRGWKKGRSGKAHTQVKGKKGLGHFFYL
ncbi:hypothetical protein BLX87_22600, partial [Bacillus sp. VT-16-64]